MISRLIQDLDNVADATNVHDIANIKILLFAGRDGDFLSARVGAQRANKIITDKMSKLWRSNKGKT